MTNALSGLFCASLNFIDATRTIRPVSAFELDSRRGVNTTGTRALQLLHGMLPNEVVCTENLTPFLKLLPCKGKAGISSLLDGHKLFDASWQTMSIDVTRRCDGKDGQCNVHVEQTIDMVLNLERAKRSRGEYFNIMKHRTIADCLNRQTILSHVLCQWTSSIATRQSSITSMVMHVCH